MPKNPSRMTEEQYIFATNLAKVRVMRNVLRDLLPQPPFITEEEEREVGRMLRAWEERMEKAQNV